MKEGREPRFVNQSMADEVRLKCSVQLPQWCCSFADQIRFLARFLPMCSLVITRLAELWAG